MSIDKRTIHHRNNLDLKDQIKLPEVVETSVPPIHIKASAVKFLKKICKLDHLKCNQVSIKVKCKITNHSQSFKPHKINHFHKDSEVKLVSELPIKMERASKIGLKI